MPELDSKATVNQRIQMLIDKYEGGNKSAFARAVDMKSGVIGDLVGGRLNKPSFDNLLKIMAAYPSVNTEWLLTGKGSMLKPDVIVRDGDQAFIAEAKNYAKPEVAHTDTHVVTLDSAHADNTAAPVYNVKAAANYLAGYDSQEQVEQLDVISFPRFMVKGGEHAVFPVIGDSMEPTFLAKDYVLCRKIPQSDWQYVNDLTVCVVVSKPHGLQLKRVKVRPDEHLVRCKSDNRRHHSFNLDFAEVVELWRFEWRLTANAENITEDIFLKVDRLEDNLEDLRQTFQSLVAASNVPLVRAGRNNPAQ